MNFLDQKKTVFPISEKFKTRTFLYSNNMVFHAEENIILNQLFESKEDRSFLFLFNCYLTAPRPTLGHFQGDSLTNPRLITAFYLMSTRRSLGAS